MHDLVDAYSRSVAAAVQKAREKRAHAARLFDEALDHIAADFEADVAAAGAALEAGMSVRAAGFRGESIVVSNVDAPEKPSVIDFPYAESQLDAARRLGRSAVDIEIVDADRPEDS
jgi:hypothetical protein